MALLRTLVAALPVTLTLSACFGALFQPPATEDIPCDADGLCPGRRSCDLASWRCSDSPTDDSCPAPLRTCDGNCTDLQTDSLHCGRCGNACAGGQRCIAGTCKNGSGECTFCGPAQTCVDGVCTCPAGSTTCFGFLCLDTEQSAIACGGCSNTCSKVGQFCRAGACRCPEGLSECEYSCVDLRFDPEHCGKCGNACADGVCDEGQCVPACSAATGTCGSTHCWDPAIEETHCGASCASCPDGASCQAGACLCPQGSEALGGRCVDLQRDDQNCGATGAACAPGQTCSGGACACLPGLTACAEACVDLQSDPAHCGSCDHPCGAAQVCSAGSCLDACAKGLTACEGACADVNRSFFHCGECGAACSLGERCVDGQCVDWSAPAGCSSCPCERCERQRWLCCPVADGVACTSAMRCP